MQSRPSLTLSTSGTFAALGGSESVGDSDSGSDEGCCRCRFVFRCVSYKNDVIVMRKGKRQAFVLLVDFALEMKVDAVNRQFSSWKFSVSSFGGEFFLLKWEANK
jgi:hypothetical protein